MAWNRPILDHQWRRMLQILKKTSGMDCPDNRREDLMSAAAAAAEFAGTSDFESLLDLLDNSVNQALISVWISAFTIHETYFFRDGLQWSAIRQLVLPERIQARQKERTLRIWSAGCSSGDEAYTAAMTVRELLPDHDLWNIKIVGTDISSDILHKARRGVYREWAFRQTPIHVRDEYFEPHGEHHWQIRPEIARMVKFELLNLKTGAYPSVTTGLLDFDLILCRNVLIYFVQDEMDLVLQKMSQCLAPGGYLALGPAEPYPSATTGLELVKSVGSAIFRVRSGSGAGAVASTATTAKSRIATGTSGTGPVGRQTRDNVVAPLKKITPGSTVARTSTHRELSLPVDQSACLDTIHKAANLGQWEKVLELARGLTASEPLNADVFYMLGLALKELDRLEESRDALRRCLFLNHGHWLGRLLLAGLWQRDGQKAKARAQLTAILNGLGAKDAAEELPNTEGMSVGRMRALVDSQLKSLGLE